MTILTARRTFAAVTLAMLTFGIWEQSSLAQATRPSPPPSHVVIPFLANATRPTDLDFEGGECEIDAGGNRMVCTFQQVFLTTTAIAPDTCMVTTNRYERVFRRDTPTRWVSTEGPDGVCGVLDVATLHDEGGVRWTLEMQKVVTKKDAAPACQRLDTPLETFSWQNIRRSLPCKFVQPGGLSR